MTTQDIKVVIVDDSPIIRELFNALLSEAPGITVVATAEDPYDARTKIKEHNPDVITLDIEMPHMNGLQFLEKIMTLRPTPVVMASTLTQKGAEETFKALELGAVDYVAKPTNLTVQSNLGAFGDMLVEKIRIAAQAKIKPQALSSSKSVSSAQSSPPLTFNTPYKGQLLVIGSSTGGPEALKTVITALPANCPPVLVVQHMPERFTASFAERLNRLSDVTVHEASHGQVIEQGHVYIAPGERQLYLAKGDKGFYCSVKDSPKVSGHRPSVDALFGSVADIALCKKIVAVMLTGMGRDGAEQMLRLRQSGAFTIGESAATCTVYGMPRAAKEMGAVCEELPLDKIAARALTALEAV